MHKLGMKAVVLGLVSVGVLLLAAGPASARTRGYDVVNLSSSAVRLAQLSTFGTPAGEPVFEAGSPRPREGMLLQPGERFHFELENPFSYTRRASFEFRSDTGEIFYLNVDNQIDTRCNVSGNRQCEVSPDGQRIVFLDPPGSRNVLRSDDLQRQAQALRELCTKANDCNFEPLDRVKTYTQGQVYGSTVTNCEEADVDTKITAERSFAISNSVGLESQTVVDVLGLFEEKVTVKYKLEITKEEKFSQDVSIRVKPRNVAWVSVSVPVIRDTGNFTLRLGNTEWLLEKVYFDSPDPKRSGHFIADQEELSAKQLEAECSHRRPNEEAVRTSAALVKTRDHGSGTADLFAAGPESNLIYGHGGHDLLRGAGGHDRIFGGSGSDAIKGGPGRDLLVGGGGPDRIDDTGGPTTVRTGTNKTRGRDWVDVADGRGDDVVTCQTARSTVLADRGDRVGAGCGRVIRSS